MPQGPLILGSRSVSLNRAQCSLQWIDGVSISLNSLICNVYFTHCVVWPPVVKGGEHAVCSGWVRNCSPGQTAALIRLVFTHTCFLCVGLHPQSSASLHRWSTSNWGQCSVRERGQAGGCLHSLLYTRRWSTKTSAHWRAWTRHVWLQHLQCRLGF